MIAKYFQIEYVWDNLILKLSYARLFFFIFIKSTKYEYNK